MSIDTEVLKQNLDRLTQEELQQVADFIAFLKFRGQHRCRITLDSKQLETLSAEFAGEDSNLAEAGMSDYTVMLNREDKL